MVIATDRRIRVTLAVEPGDSETRAETQVRAFTDGARVAEIRLHRRRDVVELIAHEMEHVREQTEGANLPLLSVAHSGEMQRTGVTYETRSRPAPASPARSAGVRSGCATPRS